jgi:hypothetical protein
MCQEKCAFPAARVHHFRCDRALRCELGRKRAAKKHRRTTCENVLTTPPALGEKLNTKIQRGKTNNNKALNPCLVA